MPVYKRDQSLGNGNYATMGSMALKPSAQRRDPSYQKEPVTRRYPDNRASFFTGSAVPKEERRTEVGFGTRTRTPAYGDTRSIHDRRRAEPPRAHLNANPDVTRESLNIDLANLHSRQRLRAEQKRQQEEAARAALEEQQELSRRRQSRVFAALASVGVVCLALMAFALFNLLNASAQLERMTSQQRDLEAQIEKKTQVIEELEVKINRQSNLVEIQDYARDNLDMDYAAGDKVRRITLPE